MKYACSLISSAGNVGQSNANIVDMRDRGHLRLSIEVRLHEHGSYGMGSEVAHQFSMYFFIFASYRMRTQLEVGTNTSIMCIVHLSLRFFFIFSPLYASHLIFFRISFCSLHGAVCSFGPAIEERKKNMIFSRFDIRLCICLAASTSLSLHIFFTSLGFIFILLQIGEPHLL